MSVNPFDTYGSRGIATIEVVELAALGEFVARGYDDTTADHIAAAAGVSIRTYFRYFPRGKEDVMVRRDLPAAGHGRRDRQHARVGEALTSGRTQAQAAAGTV